MDYTKKTKDKNYFGSALKMSPCRLYSICNMLLMLLNFIILWRWLIIHKSVNKTIFIAITTMGFDKFIVRWSLHFMKHGEKRALGLWPSYSVIYFHSKIIKFEILNLNRWSKQKHTAKIRNTIEHCRLNHTVGTQCWLHNSAVIKLPLTAHIRFGL